LRTEEGEIVPAKNNSQARTSINWNIRKNTLLYSRYTVERAIWNCM